MCAYLNGEFVSQTEMKLAVQDAGFAIGATVTDLVRTFRNEPFRLDDHLQRFEQSCALAGVAQRLPNSTMREAAIELIRRNGAVSLDSHELILVMAATPGPMGRYIGANADGPPTLLMHTQPLPFNRLAHLFTGGARLAVPPTRAPAPNVIDPRIKHRSRLHWWIANTQARAIDPSANALLFDESGFLTETSSANILLVRDSEVVRAPVGTVLEGVSMQVVRELCARCQIPFRERRMTLDDCFAAEELMVTCTTWNVAGVSSLNNRSIPWPGPILKLLQVTWSEVVGLDVVAQFTKGG